MTLTSSFADVVSEETQEIVAALNDTAIVAITDRHGRIIFVNDKFCEISKYTKNELIGQNHNILKSGFHPPIFYKQMWNTISQGKVWHGTIKNKAKDGSFYWVKTTIYPILDLDKKPRHYVSIRVDITDLIKLHERLRESLDIITKQKQFVDIYDNSIALFRTVSASGTIIQCNNTYAKSLGYTKEEIIGQTIFQHTAEKSLPLLKNAFENWKKTEVISNMEIFLKRRDGTIFPVLLSANNLYNENGKLIGSNSILRDISDVYELRKEKEKKDKLLKRQFLKLQKLSRQKDDFLAMITHELKTPLVPIKGYVDLMLANRYGQINDEQKRALSNIKNNIDFLSKLITDLLDAQKLERGTLNLNKQVIDLSSIIRETLDGMIPVFSSKKIYLTTHFDEDLVCYCDRQRIKQVIHNILLNAIDFCPKENGHIEIYATQNWQHAILAIRDNGIGIQKSKLKNLFQKFYQIDSSLTREHGGAGLGLAICRKIIELHKGSIFVRSEGIGKGTEVSILLPLIKTESINRFNIKK